MAAVHSDILRLQVDGEYTKKFLGELQIDMRDMRERMTRLEVTIGHLPTKGFIVAVVTTTLLIGGGIASGLFGLQNYLSARQFSPMTSQGSPPGRAP